MGEPLEYASISRRAVAAIIDVPLAVITTLCVGGLVLVPLGAAARGLEDSPAREIAWRIVGFLVGLGCLTLYFALSESSGWRATVGKLLVGIEVVGPHGERIGFRTAAWRFLMKYLGAIPAGIGFIRVLQSEQRQAFHDSCAGTFVVRREQPGTSLTKRPGT